MVLLGDARYLTIRMVITKACFINFVQWYRTRFCIWAFIFKMSNGISRNLPTLQGLSNGTFNENIVELCEYQLKARNPIAFTYLEVRIKDDLHTCLPSFLNTICKHKEKKREIILCVLLKSTYSSLANWNIMVSWWRHQMETLSALMAICAGYSPVTGEFQLPVTRSFDVSFDLCLNKWLRKQSWGWWFETPSRPLWRYCNG